MRWYRTDVLRWTKDGDYGLGVADDGNMSFVSDAVADVAAGNVYLLHTPRGVEQLAGWLHRIAAKNDWG